MKRLLVVGSINLDLVATAPRIPLAGETLSATSFMTFPGGKGANQAFAAARLGTRVSMVGRLGNDTFGEKLRENLESGGVDATAVEVVQTSSGIALIVTAANGENAIVVIPGANAYLSPTELDKHVDVIRNAGLILTQLEIPLDTVERLAAIARKEQIPLVLDPAPAHPLSPSLLKSVDWLTPNESETCALLGLEAQEIPSDSLEEVARMLLNCGSKNILIKLGKRGCYLALADGTKTFLPAYEVHAVDTTAAGDAFNGAFASGLLQGLDPIRSASRASAVAAISVTRVGAQPSMPAQVEVEKFLEERKGAGQPI